MTPQQRRAQYGRIHAAQTALELDDAGYRELLEGLTGKRSCTVMSDGQLNHVLDWLNWLSGRRPQQPHSFRRDGQVDPHASLVRVCYSVSRLVPPGFTHSPMTSMTWQERTCGRCVTHFELLNVGELTKLIEGLKAIYRRSGQRGDETLDELPLENAAESPSIFPTSDASADHPYSGCAGATSLRDPLESTPF